MRGALFGLVAASLAIAPAARSVELEGTWYVLVHFQDKESPKPDAWRWEDRVWKFERKGDQLEWTEYPLVIFDDETGRFESARGGSAVRVVGAWEPSAAQLADIKDGLQVNSRGVKTKSLRRQDGGTAWSSSEASGAPSASVITYSEHWAIAGLPDNPVFTRDDAMGGGSTEELSGRTEYRTREVTPDEIHGSFDRDGTRIGTFRMIRSGATEGIKTAAKSQQELQRKVAVRNVPQSEMQQLVRDRLEEDLAAHGVSLTEAELDPLAADAAQAMARGESPDEIGRALGQKAEKQFFDFAKPGARPDPALHYAFPFAPGEPRRLMQGVGGGIGLDLYGNVVSATFSHRGRRSQAFDFQMPVGTPVLAARSGKVVRVVDGFTQGGPVQSLAAKANVVMMLHDDGTFAEYVHLSPGAAVKVGDTVKVGDLIGKSGNTGFTTGPHLHFSVLRMADDGEVDSVPIRFDDGSRDGVLPVTGEYYGGAKKSAESSASH